MFPAFPDIVDELSILYISGMEIDKHIEREEESRSSHPVAWQEDIEANRERKDDLISNRNVLLKPSFASQNVTFRKLRENSSTHEH